MSDAAASFAELERAVALCELRRYTDAIVVLRRVVATDPDNERPWCLLAQAELGNGNPDDALSHAKRAMSITPTFEWPHRLVSIALSHLSQHHEAIFHARESVRFAPHEAHAHMNLAQILTRAKTDPEQARVAADRALAIAPHSADAHIASGSVFYAASKHTDAERAYRNALQIDPQNSAAHNDLARTQLGRGRIAPGSLASAARGFADALSTDPGAEISRRNLNLTIRAFLQRGAYLIFVAAWFTHSLTGPNHTGSLLPLALFLLPAGFVAQFIRRLDARLRRHLLDLIRHDGKIRTPIIIEATAISLVAIAATEPAGARASLLTLAALGAFVARVLLSKQLRNAAHALHGDRPQPKIGTGILTALAATLMLLAIAFTAASPIPLPARIALAAIAAAAAATCLNTIRSRRSSD